MLRSHKVSILVGILLSCLTFVNAAQAKPKDAQNQGTPLSAIDQQHVLQDNFVLVKTVQALPKAVQRGLAGNDIRSGMADAGQLFEISDMVGPKPLPFRRLIYAGVSSGYCFVYNEYGGYGYGTQVAIYRLSNGHATLFWRAGLQNYKNFFDLPQLRNEIVAGRYYSELLTLPRATY